ncbi:Hypothetical protein PMT_2605 [Prochlorococcus marinus str. MIT 9313]|uniref:Uncharacterized protein n=1 Tax=Prochlorococcus marinus (strain MIT 9313) TaxID=74547 RepID=B9ER76_PROMM|nr:hypothetical protein [Prochlorococcus marinus]CAX32124.1 Hypothetical protein PMT_2605 [Prochlorococcus marinus str. MIT 9313]|tara:strand:+ start:153 stop:317 length:165 start_codon:yes stop_codon:yes gene_type:complete
MDEFQETIQESKRNWAEKDSAQLSNLFSGVCWIVNGQPEEESKTKNAKDSKDCS